MGRLYWNSTRTLVFTCLVIVILVGSSASAVAGGRDVLLEEDRQLVEQKATDLANSQAVLLSKAPAEWTDLEVKTYLADSLWAIYYGINYYSDENGHLPWYYPSLAGTKYVPLWPANPYGSWEPMLVLDVEDGFHAGNAVVQVCPLEFYSMLTDPRPLSFEICMFGEDSASGDHGDAAPHDLNVWAEVPEGALFMLGAYTEPANISQQKLDSLLAEEE